MDQRVEQGIQAVHLDEARRRDILETVAEYWQRVAGRNASHPPGGNERGAPRAFCAEYDNFPSVAAPDHRADNQERQPMAGEHLLRDLHERERDDRRHQPLTERPQPWAIPGSTALPRESNRRELHVVANLEPDRRSGCEDMKYYEAAIEVLKAAERPLTAREITDQAMERGLITSNGKTPVATMDAVLYVRLRGHPDLIKLEDRVDGRLKRGSVRWTLRRN